MLDFKYGDPVWHSTHGFCTVLRQWPLCPDRCYDIMSDDGEKTLIHPGDLQPVVPLAERFPELAVA